MGRGCGGWKGAGTWGKRAVGALAGPAWLSLRGPMRGGVFPIVAQRTMKVAVGSRKKRTVAVTSETWHRPHVPKELWSPVFEPRFIFAFVFDILGPYPCDT